jgi:hypothetical protein
VNKKVEIGNAKAEIGKVESRNPERGKTKPES